MPTTLKSSRRVDSCRALRARFTNGAALYGVLGHPVGHSLSPLMHNGAFSDLRLDALYLALEVAPDRLEDALAGLHAAGWKGLSVTLPHKERVFAHVAQRSERALEAGAVNTLIRKESGWWADNTDGRGYLASLKGETGLSIRNRRVLCFGAGGAARGILMEMGRQRVAEAVLTNRHPERAERLIADLRRRWPQTDWEAVGWSPRAIERNLPRAQLILNTTSCGLSGHPPLPFGLEAASPDAVVSDIVYRPLRTPLLAEARRRGLKAHGGLGMLIEQGALAFRLWTGHTLPREGAWRRMRAALSRKG